MMRQIASDMQVWHLFSADFQIGEQERHHQSMPLSMTDSQMSARQKDE